MHAMSSDVSFVTSQQAANMLGVSAQTVRRLVERGELEAQKVENGYHGRLMFRVSEIEHARLIRELQTAGKAKAHHAKAVG